MRNKPEVLAPANSLEVLKTAVEVSRSYRTL